jgi:putative hemolysin
MPIRFLILIAVLALNGFFAAAEVALVSVRKSRLRAMAAKGNVGAQAALNLLANPARLLSVTQAGVTLASLGLGWAGETSIICCWLCCSHLFRSAWIRFCTGSASVFRFC